MKGLLAAVVLGVWGIFLATQPAPAQNKVEISAKDCKRLARHTPAPDVAYQPGVDVRGNKVVGADLDGGTPLELPKVITFDIKADLRNYLGGPEADAKAASAAVLTADKASAAAAAADTAADAAGAAATEAQVIADGAATAATAAAEASEAAAAAAKADPTDEALEAAAETAAADAAGAAMEATSAAADAATVTASADESHAAADAASTAGTAEEIASYSQAAADAAEETAEQADGVVDAATVDTAAASAASAATAAADTETAIDYRDKAYDDAAEIGANLGDAVVGKVEYDIMTGRMTFNGQPLMPGIDAELAAKCRRLTGAD